jgi:hypothetical protein
MLPKEQAKTGYTVPKNPRSRAVWPCIQGIHGVFISKRFEFVSYKQNKCTHFLIDYNREMNKELTW